MVVDFAVEDHRHRPVLVEERLMPGGTEIDDGEAPHGQPDAAFDQRTLVVGTAVADAAVHGRDLLRANRPAVEAEDPDDAAHRA